MNSFPFICLFFNLILVHTFQVMLISSGTYEGTSTGAISLYPSAPLSRSHHNPKPNPHLNYTGRWVLAAGTLEEEEDFSIAAARVVFFITF